MCVRFVSWAFLFGVCPGLRSNKEWNSYQVKMWLWPWECLQLDKTQYEIHFSIYQWWRCVFIWYFIPAWSIAFAKNLPEKRLMLRFYINTDWFELFICSLGFCSNTHLSFLSPSFLSMFPSSQVHVCPDAESCPGEHQHHRHSGNFVGGETENKQRSAWHKHTPFETCSDSLPCNSDTPSLLQHSKLLTATAENTL